MADRDSGQSIRSALPAISVVSLVIAVLSLGSSAFQSWNYARNIEAVQRNVLRAENLRTCRDIIDVFFLFRLRADEANMARAPSMELKPLVYKFGALATHLANFREDSVRERYTKLNWEMLALSENAASLTGAEYRARFDGIDAEFARLNDDCAKAAHRELI
jgi:hypothetical protein